MSKRRLKAEDKDAIEAKTAALMTASQKLGEKMYADAQQAAGAAAAAQQPEAATADATRTMKTSSTPTSKRLSAAKSALAFNSPSSSGRPSRRLTRRFAFWIWLVDSGCGFAVRD